MNKPVLCTTAYGRHLELFDITGPPLAQYADANGYELVVLHERLARGRPPAWDKVVLLHTLVAEHDLVVWIDCDALVLDHTPDISGALAPDRFLHLVEHRSENGRIPNTGVLALRGGERSKRFLDRVWSQRRFIHDRWWENAAVNHLLGYRHVPRRPAARAVALAGRGRFPRPGVEQHPRRSVTAAARRPLSRPADRRAAPAAAAARGPRLSGRPVPGLLDTKVAIVTGGGGGIGRGIVERFVAEGAAVVFAEIDADRAREVQGAVGERVVGVVCDVRERGTADALVTAARDNFGRIDVLVNNVGHFGGRRVAFHEQTDDEWDELYQVNLAHVFAYARAVLPALVGQGGGGSIVNVSTIEAFRAIPTRAVYSAFKAAITGFTRWLAIEYARDGVRVNAIAPDVTETLQVPYSRWVGPDDQHLIPTWVPLGRFGRPDDIAGVAVFLASELSAFVTGTTVHVDGGTFAAGGWFPTEEGGWTNRPRRP